MYSLKFHHSRFAGWRYQEGKILDIYLNSKDFDGVVNWFYTYSTGSLMYKTMLGYFLTSFTPIKSIYYQLAGSFLTSKHFDQHLELLREFC